MGFFDKFKSRANSNSGANVEASDLLTMTAEDSLAEAARQTDECQDREFRAREKAESLAAENEGLPSVNRRKGNGALMKAVFFVFALCAVAALYAVSTADKAPKKRKESAPKEQVMNTLPPIVIPATPAPISLTPSGPAPLAGQAGQGGAQVPGIKASPGVPAAAQPIALQAGSSTKATPTWEERKMGGSLLVESKFKADIPGASKPTVLAADGEQGAGFGRPAGAANELAAKLEPTIVKGVSATILPNRNFLITKGTALDCALETALDSSVPGLTSCRLTRDVYSDNGQVLLLDRGSQLVGEYQGGLKQGQVRLFVLWTRAKTPNGVVVSLNSPGTDTLGRSGLSGWVDNHFAERFGAAILMSFIKDAVSAAAKNGGTTNIYGGSMTGGEKIIEKILDSTVNIPPTIVKNQGDHIQVMVARDLDFSGVYSLQVKQ